MRAVGDLASAYDQCSGVLFVDLTSAFASINRLLAFGGPSSPEELSARLKVEGFAPDACRRFVDAISALDIWHSMSRGARKDLNHMQAFLAAGLDS